jgi:hypothetical protein
VALPFRTAAILRQAARMLAIGIDGTAAGRLSLAELEALIDARVSLRLEQALDVGRGHSDSRRHTDPPSRHNRAALPRLDRGRAVRRKRSRARAGAAARLAAQQGPSPPTRE